MKHITNLGLSLLVAATCAGPAAAALSGDNGGEAALENSDSGSSMLQRLDQLLNEGNHPDLQESILQRHAKAAQRATAPMEGHYAREGAENPLQLGQQDTVTYLPRQLHLEAVAGEAFSLAQASAVHMVGSNAVAGEAPVAMAAVASGTSYIQPQEANAGTSTGTPESGNIPSTSNGQQAVPLPPAFLLMASGLFGLPAVRRLANRRS
jgi:hypothetical protein